VGGPPKNDKAKIAPFWLRSVRLPVPAAPPGLPAAGDGLVAADIRIDGGTIARITPPETTGAPTGMVWPCPVDCHTHIDKGQTWPRAANPDGTFGAALEASGADVVHQGPDDIRRRAAFQVASAHAHGTVALRSHVDAAVDTFDAKFAVLTELAEDWRGRVDVQLAPFTGPEEPEAWVDELAKRARHATSGVLSAFLYTVPELPDFLDRMIRLADRHGLALDFHADENLDPASHCTRAVAEAVIRNRFSGPVLVGHACALSVQPPEILNRTLDLVAEAGLAIVSLPLCNAYLMGRWAGTPRQRGFAPVHELKSHGIPVAIASDNVRDAFYAYGDLDAVDLFRDAIRMMQLDHPVGAWSAAVTTTAADAIGRPDLGRIREGAPANLVWLPARTWSEFCARPQSARRVFKAGVEIDTTPPAFETLDDLKGCAP
jgi:cytosine deaminase